MGQELVSIIIPTYNRCDMVVDAIESAIGQSYKATQIIVIDDGSEDDTAKRVAEFAGVEYYYQENKGQAAARNLGLAHAKGRYIASLDSDDVWDPTFLKVAVDAIERYEADFVFLNWRQVSEGEYRCSDLERNRELQRYDSNTDEGWAQLGPGELRTLFLKGCAAPSSALVARRASFLSNWNEEMRIADDWYLLLEMVLMKPCRAAFTRLPYWTKKVHSTNIYHGRDDLEIISDLGLHDEVIMSRDFCEQLSWREKAILNRRLSAHHFNFSRFTLRRGGLSLKALSSMIRAFALAPVGGVAYCVLLSFNHVKHRMSTFRNRKTALATNLAIKKIVS